MVQYERIILIVNFTDYWYYGDYGIANNAKLSTGKITRQEK